MSSQDTLEVVAGRITAMAKKSDEYIISAAVLVHEARQRVKCGEAGRGVKWEAWAAENIKLSKSRIKELQRIGAADDPEGELCLLREGNRQRVQRHRGKAADQKGPLRNGPLPIDEGLEPERAKLIQWASSAPLEEVRRVLKMTKPDIGDIPEQFDRRKKAA